MKFVNKTLMAAVIAAASVSSAQAGQFYIDLTTPGLGTGDGITGNKDQIEFAYESTTVITLTDLVTPKVSVGDAIKTTGGLDFTDQASLNASFDTNRAGGLLPGFDSEGLTADRSTTNTSEWGLSFTFDLDGKVESTLAGGTVVENISYQSGTIEVYLISFDGAGNVIADNIFDMTVTGSNNSNPANFLINGLVSFSGDEVYTDIFHFVGKTCLGDDSFAALAGCTPPVEISFQLDQNLDDETVDFSNIGVDGTATIAGNHNGSVDFFVPEPGTLLLMGGALAGLGFSRRKKA